jgi:hypothetical protein
MPMCLASALLAILSLCLFSFVPSPARACSVCLPGDPHFSGAGASAQEQGSFSLYLETRGYSKTSGGLTHAEPGEEPHETDEDSRGQRLDLYASWTPIDRVTLTLDVPVVWNRITHYHHEERTHSTLSGLGDVALSSSLVLWRDRPVLPSRWLEGRVWLKAPTGRDETKVDGERDPHLQPGTGSWDVGVGLAGVQRLAWGSLYGSVFRRWNNDGSLDYEYGDVWLASLGLEGSLGHLLGRPSLDFLTPGLGLDFRYASYDQQADERYEDSGGAILYASPSLRVRLPWGMAAEQPASLRFAVQLPLGQTWLHNRQYEKAVWSVGILAPF